MKITAILMLAACLQVGATGYTQTVSLSVKDAQLETVFREIRKQTGYNFIFTREVISAAHPVNINVQNASLNDVLEICFQNQPLSFSIEDKFVVIKRKILKSSIEVPDDPSIYIKGKVFNNNGEPIAGATVTVKNTKQATATNEQGEFFLPVVDENATLVISSIGHKTKEVKLQGRNSIEIQLEVSVSSLDETVVIAYGTTTRRLNTGSVGRITATEIEKQPVSNPLAAMQGRVPGLVITQSSGVPGSAFKVEIRGRNSITQGSEPLFIIDGVPFAPNNNSLNQLSSVAASNGSNGLSPFNTINPSDIESIEILRDADATAIYGSRGANGVILITTKKGKPGKLKLVTGLWSGVSRVTKLEPMMNTQQYVEMRKEAHQNDGISPNVTNAPDLLVWDTSRYTNFNDLLINGTANVINMQASLSGGSENTNFLIATNYHSESTPFSGNLKDDRGTLHFNVNNSVPGNKFITMLSGSYASEKNNLVNANPAGSIHLPPNLPPLYDSIGKLNWEGNGVSFDNPLAYMLETYEANTENILGNLQLSYNPLPDFNFKISLGYNSLHFSETSTSPIAARNPNISSTGSSKFADRSFKSWIIEPQTSFSTDLLGGNISFLLGSSFQQTSDISDNITATGYTNDALLRSASGAASIILRNDYSLYRYAAFFGRINYNFQDKYLLNLTGRRDGSSRFGEGRQFASFGAVGTGWIFSKEKWILNNLPFISFGKVRTSYGITGNDQIGNYQYLDRWRSTTNPYNNIPGLLPSALSNSSYNWELNRKFETAFELGFLDNKILFTTAYYKNRSSNQLVRYALPSQTGFTTIIKNFPAVVQNTGLEFEVTSNVISKKFRWTSEFNISFHRNKLAEFPGIENSSYAHSYIVGKPLNLIYAYHYEGVDPTTGVFKFSDLNKDSILSSLDRVTNGNLDPTYWGGLNNTFTYKNFELDLLFTFVKQIGKNYLSSIHNYKPGTLAVNMPERLIHRWQKPGDISDIQKYTASSASQASKAWTTLSQSDGIYSDASFIRLKNLSISWKLPSLMFEKFKTQNIVLYIRGQNLITITNYKGGDPENQNLFSLPPLKTITAGFQVIF